VADFVIHKDLSISDVNLIILTFLIIHCMLLTIFNSITCAPAPRLAAISTNVAPVSPTPPSSSLLISAPKLIDFSSPEYSERPYRSSSNRRNEACAALLL
jgi:hypothetical protein